MILRTKVTILALLFGMIIRFFKKYEKQINNRLFMFHAGKLEIISQLSRRYIKAF
jgi:hypothetical protein